MELPDRNEVIGYLDRMLESWNAKSVAGSDSYAPEPKPPAVYCIGLLGHGELSSLDAEGMERALVEITRRLDRLVRADDVLGKASPDQFLLATAAVAPSTAGVIMERVTGAVAMPLDIGGQPVSLSVGIGLAFAFDGASSEAMIAAAEKDMAHRSK
ncbi:MAG TPA: diguanylate cyclase [Microthrixaceae bacterium]|nr:diguanylate cyclase [Microthrixaceae bacterium]